MTSTTTTSTGTTSPRTGATSPPPTGDRRYVEVDRFTARVFNPVVAWLTRRGLSLWGSRVLEVRGRSSGEWRSTPVNLLGVAGADHLVAPRGETHWVRNLRVAGEGRLRLGRRVEQFRAVELVDDAAKATVLRAYLRRWKWEAGQFFDGLDADAPDEALRAAAPGYPVFRIERIDAHR